MTGNEGTNRPILDYRTPVKRETSGWAVASLAFGVLCWVPAIPFLLAFYCAYKGAKDIELNGRSGKKLVNAGMWLGTLGLLWTCLLALAMPVLWGPRAGSRTYCDNNLKQIGVAMRQYANDNENQFPPDFETLLRTMSLTPRLFICPSTVDIPSDLDNNVPASDPTFSLKGHVSYIYLRPDKTIDKINPNTVVLYEPLTNHNYEGMYVLFGDMNVDFVEVAEARMMSVELQMGKNPPPSKTWHHPVPPRFRKPFQQKLAEWTFYSSSILGIFFLVWIARRCAFS